MLLKTYEIKIRTSMENLEMSPDCTFNEEIAEGMIDSIDSMDIEPKLCKIVVDGLRKTEVFGRLDFVVDIWSHDEI